jgi:hypothetical protein
LKRQTETPDIYRKIADYLVPALLSAACSILWGIKSEMADMGKALAVAVQRVEDLDRRVSNLEAVCLNPSRIP